MVHQNDSSHVHKFAISFVTLFSSLILYVLLSSLSHWTQHSSYQSSLSCFWQNCCVTRSDKLQFPRWRSRCVLYQALGSEEHALPWGFFLQSFTTVAERSVPRHRLRLCAIWEKKNVLAHSQTAPISAAEELQYMWILQSTSCYTFQLFIVWLWVTGMVWHLKAWSLFKSFIFSVGFEYLLFFLNWVPVVLNARHYFR